MEARTITSAQSQPQLRCKTGAAAAGFTAIAKRKRLVDAVAVTAYDSALHGWETDSTEPIRVVE